MDQALIHLILDDRFKLFWCLLIAGFFAVKTIQLISKIILSKMEFRRAAKLVSDAQAILNADNQAKLKDMKNLSPFWRSFFSHLITSELSDDKGQQKIYLTRSLPQLLEEHSPLPNLRTQFSGVGSMLTGLGVLGTFIGLAIGVYVSREGLASQDLGVMQKTISGLLTAAGLAFMTSLVGLASSLLFTTLEKNLARIAYSSQQHLTGRLNKFVGFLPQEIVLTNSQSSQWHQIQILEKIEQKISASLNQRVEIHQETLKQGMEVFANSLHNIFKAETHHLSQLLLSLSHNLEGSVVGLSKSSESVNKVLVEANSKLAETSQCIARNLNDAFESSIHKHKNFIDSSFNRIKAIEEISEKSLNKTISQLNQTLQNLEASAKTLGNSFGNQRLQDEQSHNFEHELLVSIKQQSARVRDVVDNMDQTFIRLESSLNNQIAKMLSGINLALEKVVHHTGNNQMRLSQNFEELRDVVQKMYEMDYSPLLKAQVKL